MSISIQTDVIGLKELEKALKDLGIAAGQKGGPVKNALRAAAQPVLASAQMDAAKHFQTGVLLESLKVMRHPNPRYLNEIQGVGVHNMGRRPPKGEDQNTGKPWYAEIVEYGGRGKTGPLKGFLRRALETNRDTSTKIYRTRLAVGIERIAKKVGNKNAAAVASKIKRL
jgi:hypothetical protein